MKKTILIFGALIVCLLILFNISKYAVVTGNLKIEYTIAGIAILFFFIGIYINKRNASRLALEHESAIKEIDEAKIKALGLSAREYEILVEITKGYSNKQIAEHLFVSESTVKSHVSNLFVKLDAKRRTQAIQKAKEMQIIT